MGNSAPLRTSKQKRRKDKIMSVALTQTYFTQKMGTHQVPVHRHMQAWINERCIGYGINPCFGIYNLGWKIFLDDEPEIIDCNLPNRNPLEGLLYRPIWLRSQSINKTVASMKLTLAWQYSRELAGYSLGGKPVRNSVCHWKIEETNWEGPIIVPPQHACYAFARHNPIKLEQTRRPAPKTAYFPDYFNFPFALDIAIGFCPIPRSALWNNDVV